MSSGVSAPAEAAGACANGYPSAITGIDDAESIPDGVAQAKDEIEALGASCEGSLGS